MSVQRQVLFRSQHLHDILGLLAYNPSVTSGKGGQIRSQGTTKKPEPQINHSVATGSKNSQIHVDGAKEEEQEQQNGDDGEGRGVKDTSRSSRGERSSNGSDTGSFPTSNEGDHREPKIFLPIQDYQYTLHPDFTLNIPKIQLDQ